MNKTEQLLLDLPPDPAALIASLRDIGYSFCSAVADLIDNSITAGARRIDVRALWNRGKPTVAVIDDGCGMSEEELKAAMRFGSTSPLMPRTPTDLGRFGLGLKTASISQCRKLQVVSRKRGVSTCAIWDLERICKSGDGRWSVIVERDETAFSESMLTALHTKYLAEKSRGTIVLWSDMDRMEEDETETSFNGKIAALRGHLGLTFHRLIKQGSKGLSIFVNDLVVVPFDPFNESNLACQSFPEESIIVDGQVIKAQAYVLPHHSKMTGEEYERFAGLEGYRGSQGFYVYRNKRLIISGTWFRLRPREELTKLVRIRVDIPNSLDSIWKIDIKKSGADLPEKVRKELRRVIPVAISRGKDVVRHRGYALPAAVSEPLWSRREVNKTISYAINQNGYAFRHFLETLSLSQHDEFLSLVRLLESRLPTDQLYADICDKPKAMHQEALSPEVIEFFLDCYLLAHPEATEEAVLSTDPFFLHASIVRRLMEQRKKQ